MWSILGIAVSNFGCSGKPHITNGHTEVKQQSDGPDSINTGHGINVQLEDRPLGGAVTPLTLNSSIGFSSINRHRTDW